MIRIHGERESESLTLNGTLPSKVGQVQVEAYRNESMLFMNKPSKFNRFLRGMMAALFIFAVVTCAILWGTGKVFEIGAPAKAQDQQSALNVNSESIQMAKFAEMIENLSKNVSDLVLENEKLRAGMDSLNASNSELVLANSKLSEEIDYLTLDNSPVTIGQVTLGYTLLGYGIKISNQNYQLIYRNGAPLSFTNPGGSWVAKAAMNDSQGYIILMRRRATKQFEKWRIDGNYTFVNAISCSLGEILTIEETYNVDLDEDHHIGPRLLSPFVLINGVTFARSDGGYAISIPNTNPILIRYGEYYASDSYPGNGWTAIGAARSNQGYQLFMKNSMSSLSFEKWNVDSNGVYISTQNMSYSDMLEAERELKYDILQDGRIGIDFVLKVPTVTIGAVVFGRTNALGSLYGMKRDTDPIQVILFNNTFVSPSIPGKGWRAIAMSVQENDPTQYFMYWRNNNQLSLWSVNKFLTVYNSSTQSSASATELKYNFDWNGNGVIGS